MIKLADNIGGDLDVDLYRPPGLIARRMIRTAMDPQFVNTSKDPLHPAVTTPYTSIKLPVWSKYMTNPPQQPLRPPQSIAHMDSYYNSVPMMVDGAGIRKGVASFGFSPEDYAKAVNSLGYLNEDNPVTHPFHGVDASTLHIPGIGTKQVRQNLYDRYRTGARTSQDYRVPFTVAPPPPTIPWYQPRMTTPSNFWPQINEGIEDLKGAGRDLKNWIWPEDN